MEKNPDKHIPGIYDYKFSNISPTVTKKYTDLFGQPSRDNLYKFWDRRHHMGINKIDEQELAESYKNLTTLTKKIIKRNQPFINISNHKAYEYPKNFNYIDHEGYKKYMNDFIGSRNNNLKRGIWWDFYKHSD